MYFINGMFWQQGQMPFIGHDAQIGEVVMLGERQLEAVFSGLIGELSLTDGNDGFLVDIFGQSVLSNFSVSETKMEFRKQYRRRLDDDAFLIQYTFTKSEGGIWNGDWKAPAVGKGEARCMLTEIPSNFFAKAL